MSTLSKTSLSSRLNIRLAQPKEINKIENYIEKIAFFHGDTYHKNAKFVLQEIFSNSSSLNVFFADLDEETVGFAVIYWAYALHLGLKRMHLHLFFVDEAHRSVGVGRGIMEHLEHVAGKHGAHVIEVGADIENERAQQTYLALGFKRRSINGAHFKKILDK